jgi:hypothetical protein
VYGGFEYYKDLREEGREKAIRAQLLCAMRRTVHLATAVYVQRFRSILTMRAQSDKRRMCVRASCLPSNDQRGGCLLASCARESALGRHAHFTPTPQLTFGC